MKRTRTKTTYAAGGLAALVGLIALALGVYTNQTPDTYPVTIKATFEGKGRHPGMHVDVTIRTATSIYERALLMTDSAVVEVLDPPPYTWRLKGFWHLATSGTAEGAEIDAGLQLAGDTPSWERDDTYCSQPPCYRPVTGDNRVDAEDYTRLKVWLGQPQPCCTPGILDFAAVDFDASGTVDSVDEGLLKANFGKAGE